MIYNIYIEIIESLTRPHSNQPASGQNNLSALSLSLTQTHTVRLFVYRVSDSKVQTFFIDMNDVINEPRMVIVHALKCKLVQILSIRNYRNIY